MKPAYDDARGNMTGIKSASGNLRFQLARFFIGALAAIKPLVLPGVGKKTLVYVIKTSVL